MRNAASECIGKIREIDYNLLDISEYNRKYIHNLLPHLEYYFSIYTHAVSSLPTLNKESCVVDFGGGHGFLSLYLKVLGYRVIYCDHNPLSVKTIRLIKEQLGFGPDYIVTGGSGELNRFCVENQLIPTHLIGTDVIEHIYDLSAFFHDMQVINPSFEMAFTTASNPANSYKCRRLRKLMKKEEKDYAKQREAYIRNDATQLSDKEIDVLVKHTRGSMYSDIDKAVERYLRHGTYPPLLTDPYNTCDPATGNWTERILPFKAYEQLANTYGFKIDFTPGLYNEKRDSRSASLLFRIANLLIRKGKWAGYFIAPYIAIRLYND